MEPSIDSVEEQLARYKKTMGSAGLRKIIDVSRCKFDIVRECAKELGWKINESERGTDFDLYWTDFSVTSERVARLQRHQRINHFPSMYDELCRKVPMIRNLNRMKRQFPTDYEFYPQSWILPYDFGALQRRYYCSKSQTFIVKPDSGSKGQGIYITNDVNGMDPSDNAIVQKYISDPLLMDGFKFDLRVYVLVISCDPLRILLHRDGIVRLCTEPYREPGYDNMEHKFMHLTNYAINKDSETFEPQDKEQLDGSNGSKRDFAYFNSFIQDKGKDPGELWNEISGVIIKTLIAVQPSLQRAYRKCQPFQRPEHSSCFELLGFDIMIDQKFKPWLLEVNHSPSLGCDSPLDYRIKHALIGETLSLVFMDDESDKKSSSARVAKGRRSGISVETSMKGRLEFEREMMQGYSTIFPTERTRRYEYLFKQEVTLTRNAQQELELEKLRIEAEWSTIAREQALEKLRIEHQLRESLKDMEIERMKADGEKQELERKKMEADRRVAEIQRLMEEAQRGAALERQVLQLEAEKTEAANLAEFEKQKTEAERRAILETKIAQLEREKEQALREAESLHHQKEIDNIATRLAELEQHREIALKLAKMTEARNEFEGIGATGGGGSGGAIQYMPKKSVRSKSQEVGRWKGEWQVMAQPKNRSQPIPVKLEMNMKMTALNDRHTQHCILGGATSSTRREKLNTGLASFRARATTPELPIGGGASGGSGGFIPSSSPTASFPMSPAGGLSRSMVLPPRSGQSSPGPVSARPSSASYNRLSQSASEFPFRPRAQYPPPPPPQQQQQQYQHHQPQPQESAPFFPPPPHPSSMQQPFPMYGASGPHPMYPETHHVVHEDDRQFVQPHATGGDMGVPGYGATAAVPSQHQQQQQPLAIPPIMMTSGGPSGIPPPSPARHKQLDRSVEIPVYGSSSVGGGRTSRDGSVLSGLEKWESLSEAIHTNPNSAFNYWNLARRLQSGQEVTLLDGRVFNDRQLFTIAIDLDKSHALAYEGLGQRLQSGESITLLDGRVLDKKQLFMEAIRCDSGCMPAYQNLAKELRPGETVVLADGATWTRKQLMSRKR